MECIRKKAEAGGGKANSRFTTYNIVFIGVFSAVVFVSNFLSIQMGEISRIHFGNVFCVLSGLLLGPLGGGLSAGIGSFFYDLFNPLFASEALITFVMKFALGAVTGLIAYRGGRQSRSFVLNLTGAITGSVCYVILYLTKNFIKEYFLIKNPIDTVWALMLAKGGTSLLNAVIAVVVAMALIPVFSRVFERSGIEKKLRPH